MKRLKRRKRRNSGTPDQHRFNSGYHDGASASKYRWQSLLQAQKFSSPENLAATHFDKLYGAGFLAGYYDAKEGHYNENSTSAWSAYKNKKAFGASERKRIKEMRAPLFERRFNPRRKRRRNGDWIDEHLFKEDRQKAARSADAESRAEYKRLMKNGEFSRASNLAYKQAGNAGTPGHKKWMKLGWNASIHDYETRTGLKHEIGLM